MFEIILLIYLLTIVPFGWKIALTIGVIIDIILGCYNNKHKNQ